MDISKYNQHRGTDVFKNLTQGDGYFRKFHREEEYIQYSILEDGLDVKFDIKD
jgi:hypothetical protein